MVRNASASINPMLLRLPSFIRLFAINQLLKNAVPESITVFGISNPD